MEKAIEKDLYSIRWSQEAKPVAIDLIKSVGISVALLAAKRILDMGKIIQRCEVKLYNQHNGEPENFEWRPYDKWDGKLWIDGFIFPTIEKNIMGHRRAAQANGIVALYIPEYAESGGTTPAYILFELTGDPVSPTGK